jgi:anti-anti-sigma regulatory factor
MLRITMNDDGDTVRLTLEGQLHGPWVGELEKACRPALDTGRTLLLDLAEVNYADHVGARLLVCLGHSKASLLRPSAFLREQLKRQRSAGRLSDPPASG